jgi:hypothetical protein
MPDRWILRFLTAGIMLDASGENIVESGKSDRSTSAMRAHFCVEQHCVGAIDG